MKHQLLFHSYVLRKLDQAQPYEFSLPVTLEHWSAFYFSGEMHLLRLN